MIRLLWLATERVDPEETFPPLMGRRPAPEPLAFSGATVDLVSKSLAEVILVDGRQSPTDAAAVIRKLRGETEAAFIVVLDREGIPDFDWSCGPSDFVSSDCSREEFDARIVRLAQPFEPDPSELVRRGEITISNERFEVRVRGEVLDLTYREFVLLNYLASRPGKVCSRRELLTEVWGYEYFGGTRTVDVHIRRLRAKLGPAADQIETVRNVGYRFAG
ncbi:MAG: winged helix-turn-helix domain-containing protein [Acidimicrobiia bacterium]